MKARKRRATTVSAIDPPPYNAAVVTNNTFRFLSTGAVGVNVSLQQLLAVCGMVTTTVNTTATKLADSVKINSVKIWSPSSLGARVEISWLSTASIFTRPVAMSDICTSTSVPAHIFTVPPKNELFSDWLVATSTSADINIFQITCPANSIVEINLTYQEYTGLSNTLPSVFTFASGAAVLGNIYYGFLDTSATHKLPPVDLPGNF